MGDWQGKSVRNRRLFQGREGMTKGVYLAQVNTFNPDKDRCSVSHLNNKEFLTRHPYIGPNSWIRAAPEAGSGVLLGPRFDTKDQEVYGYLSREPEKLISAYRNSSGVMRPLREGETEVMSPGFAYWHASRRGTLTLRGGMIWQKLDNDSLTLKSRAPLYQRQLANHTSQALGDEERFGAVVRPGLIVPTFQQFVTVGPIPAKEYYRSLKSDRTPSGTLVERHEGDVTDVTMVPKMAGMSGLPLRSSVDWHTESGQKVSREIDNTGNISWSVPSTALLGIRFNVSAGNFKVNAGAGIELSATPGINLSTTGVVTTSFITLDGLSWNHGHMTPMGLTSGPLPLG